MFHPQAGKLLACFARPAFAVYKVALRIVEGVWHI